MMYEINESYAIWKKFSVSQHKSTHTHTHFVLQFMGNGPRKIVFKIIIKEPNSKSEHRIEHVLKQLEHLYNIKSINSIK